VRAQWISRVLFKKWVVVSQGAESLGANAVNLREKQVNGLKKV